MMNERTRASRRARIVLSAAIAVMAVLAGGCSLTTRPAPVKQTYLIEPTVPPRPTPR